MDQARARGVRARRWRPSGSSDPARCVYVGDRLFDDIWGAHNAGLKAIHIPHSASRSSRCGHTEGEPDAVAHELADIPGLLDGL